jgi:iron(III) transport system substrate-binding protein
MAKIQWQRCTFAAAAARAVIIAAIGTAGLTATAFADTAWDAVVAAANKEGKVVLYSAQPAAVTEQVMKLFNAQYPGIQVSIVNDSAAVLATRYESERKASGHSPGDVLDGATFGPMTFRYPDWFNDVLGAAPDFVPNFAEFPESAKYKKSIISAAYDWNFAYNASVLKPADLPKSWVDIADPKWKGRGAMVDPRTSASYMSWFVFERKELGDDFIRALAANNFTLTNGGLPTAQAVASGQVEFGFPIARSHSAAIRANGAPVAHVDLKPFEVNTTAMSLPTDSPSPNAARVLANFMLSPEAQEAICAAGDLSSFNVKAAGPCTPLKMSDSTPKASLNIPEDDRDAVIRLLNLQQ